MMAEARALLRQVRELLSREEAWHQQDEAWSVNAAGEVCHPLDVGAVKWCLYGAMLRVCHDGIAWEVSRVAYKLLYQEISPSHGSAISWANAASTTHADILAVLDRAISG